jgi:hypothetical protein
VAEDAGAPFWGDVSVLGGVFLTGLLCFFVSNEVLLEVLGASTKAVVERIVEAARPTPCAFASSLLLGAAPVRATVELVFGRTRV